MIVDSRGRKREKSNAKMVELLDMDRNSLGVYPSGIAVANALGIQQGDVSLCCRGLKHSVANHRFRFYGDPHDQYELMKKRKREQSSGYIIENIIDDSTSVGSGGDGGGGGGGGGRTRRVSRGDYRVKVTDKFDYPKVPRSRNHYVGPKFSEVTHVKVRKWEKKSVSAGNFSFKKWVPETAEPTTELRAYMPQKKVDLRKSKNKNPRRANVALQSRY